MSRFFLVSIFCVCGRICKGVPHPLEADIHTYLLILSVRTLCRVLKGQTGPTGVHLKATHEPNIKAAC